jgi:dienelactone hydrolase
MRVGTVLVVLVFLSRAAFAQDAPGTPSPPADEIVLREALRIERTGTSARSLVHTDAVEALIVGGEWKTPRPGEEIELPDGSMRRWVAVKAGDDGAFAGEVAQSGAYLSFRVPSDAERVMLLHGVGHDFVYVNGELRPGDPYGYGWLRLPVLLKKGANELLFRASRGRFSARLVTPPAPVFVSLEDATTQDVGDLLPARMQDPDVPAAVVVINATTSTANDVSIRAAPIGATLRSVASLSVAKAPIRIPRDTVPVGVTLATSAGATSTISLPRRQTVFPDVVRRVYVSDVDGSVQYYAVRPAVGDGVPGLVLSLHGASVEATSQAEAYGPQRAWTIVCPTNRRPFGFDWETWGRRDALDVLGIEWERLNDKSRVVLTGHSMGGHGTWHLGVLQPEAFAAIGPSAGWSSFASYGGAPAGPPVDAVDAMVRRAASPSDTKAYVSNLKGLGVYVLHGDADDNVPVAEARGMVEALRAAKVDVTLHEQEGAGHWWDASDAPGASCVDWPPMMDTFARRRIPSHEQVADVDFVTPDPSVAGLHHWLVIERQVRSRVPSRVRIRREGRRFVGTTENVAALALDLEHLGRGDVEVELDGTKIGPASARKTDSMMQLEKRADRWSLASSIDTTHKHRKRAGPFSAAFDHRFVLVVGTKGTPEENAWAAAKARLDAENWYYRANGSPEVVDDVSYEPPRYPARGHNAILYGHAEMNAAWDVLLGSSPVQVRRGGIRVGARELEGENLACLFVRPIPGTVDLSVGVVAGTGMAGLRLTDRLPYFASGVGIPDAVVLSTDMLSKGLAGVVGAGFFGEDWSVEKGEFAWR